MGAELSADLPAVWQGRLLHFQAGIFLDAATSESDFSNVVGFTLNICRDRSENSGLLLVSSSIFLEGMDSANAIALADWDAGTAQHLTFVLTGSQMDVELAEPDERLWWAIEASLTSAEAITVGAGYITFREDGFITNTATIGPLAISITDGIATITVGSDNYSFVVTGTPGTQVGELVEPSVTAGVAAVVLNGATYNWPVSGSPGTMPAGPVAMLVTNGIATMALGGVAYTFAVYPA